MKILEEKWLVVIFEPWGLLGQPIFLGSRIHISLRNALWTFSQSRSLIGIFILSTHTGLLPSRNRVCTLGSCSPGKKILHRNRGIVLLFLTYTCFNLSFNNTTTLFLTGIHQKSNCWVDQSRCCNERLEEKNQVGSDRENWVSCDLRQSC